MSELALKLIAENKAKHERGEDARVLDLGNCELKEIPSEVRELFWIEEINFKPYTKTKWKEPYNKTALTGLSELIWRVIRGDHSVTVQPINQIKDLSPLVSLSNLKTVNCAYTSVRL